MVDVFISYSRADQAIVAQLAHAVEAAGYDVWWDAELPPHQSYGDVITDKIASAKAAIVVWSPTAVKSEWVRAEADMARNQRKLIQTALDDVMPPLPFNQIQYADLGGWNGEEDHPGWRKVRLSLAELCGGRAGEQTMRPVPPQPSPHSHLQREPEPPIARRAAQWPLYAGIGIAVLALAIAGAIVLVGRGGDALDPSPEAVPGAVVAPLPEAPEAAPVPAAQPAIAPDSIVSSAEDAPPFEPDPEDMTFADSSTRLLTYEEVSGLGPTTLRVARNEIYARKGRRFRDPWLREWFGRYPWYRPRYDEVALNPVEQRNIELIQAAEQRYR